MTVLGMVTEYNPFHNGHLLHLQKSKEVASADYTIAVMSGNFVQRGEPAIVNKWARTAMALSAGVDLIIELPVIYAISSAEFFAEAAIKLLDSLGIVNSLCFGSETGSIAPLNAIAEILVEEPEEYKQYLKQYLDSGISFPLAREKSIYNYIQNLDQLQNIVNTNYQDLQNILGSSNNILGIEYLKALKKLNSNIVPYTIRRQANLYNEENLTGKISSATAIRKHINEIENMVDGSKIYHTHLMHNQKDINYALPPESLDIIRNEFKNGRAPVLISSFESIILAILRKISIDDIRGYPNINEGLENRIKKAGRSSGSLEELIENICTKRYTRTRIQRIILSILLGITSSQFQYFNAHGGPQYIRVLGFNKKGRKLLAEINKKARLPVIVKTANFINSENQPLRKMLELEAMAGDIYVLGYKNPNFRYAGQEFTQGVIIKDNNFT